MQSRSHATKLAKKSALPFRSQFGFVNLFQRAWFKYVVAAKNSCCLRRFGTAPFARTCKSSSAWPCAHVACMIKSEMCATSSPLSLREAVTSCRSSIAAAFWILLTEAWRGVPSTPARASLAAPRRRPSASKPTKFYRATKFVPTDNFCFDRQFLFPETIFVPTDNFCSDRQFLFRPTNFVPTDNFCFDRQILSVAANLGVCAKC